MHGRVKLPPKLESSVTSAFRDLLKEKHPEWKFVKLSIMGQKDWPDYEVLAQDGQNAYVEFKRPGKEPTERQYEMLKWLNDNGYSAEWFDNAKEAVQWLEDFLVPL